MLEITDTNFFAQIVADALASAELKCADKKERTRWVAAIGKGVAMLHANPTFIHWQREDKSLLIWSDSNEIYSANGVCQCRAFTEGLKQRGKPFPCKHRALARLVRIYFELQEKPARRSENSADGARAVISSDIAPPASLSIHSFNDAPYLKPTIQRKTETYGGVKI